MRFVCFPPAQLRTAVLPGGCRSTRKGLAGLRTINMHGVQGNNRGLGLLEERELIDESGAQAATIPAQLKPRRAGKPWVILDQQN
jgi:hypothetical protein